MAYTPKAWADGELITAEDLNDLEAGVGRSVETTDPRLSDARAPLPHAHALDDVTGLAARLAALDADTGDRDITVMLPEYVAGDAVIRRVGLITYLSLYDLKLTYPGTYIQWSGLLPAGFRPTQTTYVSYPCAVRSAAYTLGPLRVDKYGGITIYGPDTLITAVTVSWVSDSPFPTALPGDPA